MQLGVEQHTAAAALAARERLTTLAGGAPREQEMAAVARAAIFEEALLGALRARFAELRTAAK